MSDTLFYSTKRDFDETFETAEAMLGEYVASDEMPSRQRNVEECRRILDQCNSHLSSMEVYWDALPPNEKGYHKTELLEYRN